MLDWGIVIGVFTAILLAAYVGIVVWAYGKGRKKAFEVAARCPLYGEGDG
jgi:cbb3-type cytochrome oxidase subunit 3